MTWNIAQAKQQFSELVRLSAQEPQAIYKHDTPVATMVNAQEFAAFRAWRSAQQTPTLLAQFAQGRAAVAELEGSFIDTDRVLQRHNPFTE
jgi:antitoxin (DNA-binding transcriptional repressor) of toxin-antitoxin stability system